MNIKLRIEMNSGSALVLFTVSFFLLTLMAAVFSAVASLYAIALAGLTGAFGGYLVKRNSNNKITLEAEKSGVSLERTGDPLK